MVALVRDIIPFIRDRHVANMEPLLVDAEATSSGISVSDEQPENIELILVAADVTMGGMLTNDEQSANILDRLVPAAVFITDTFRSDEHPENIEENMVHVVSSPRSPTSSRDMQSANMDAAVVASGNDIIGRFFREEQLLNMD